MIIPSKSFRFSKNILEKRQIKKIDVVIEPRCIKNLNERKLSRPELSLSCINMPRNFLSVAESFKIILMRQF
jgi:hypothetical protein